MESSAGSGTCRWWFAAWICSSHPADFAAAAAAAAAVTAPDVTGVESSTAGTPAPATERLQDALTSMQVTAAVLISNRLWPSLSSRRLGAAVQSPVTGGCEWC